MGSVLYRNFFRDLVLVAAAFLLSLATGILANRLRSDPLPFPYRERILRLKEEVSGTEAPVVVALSAAETAWRKGSAVFVDARESDFFEEGHIPGAVNLSVSGMAKALPAGMPSDKSASLIVYCSGGDCEDSGIVARALLKRGYRDVAVFTGGWEEWSAAGISR